MKRMKLLEYRTILAGMDDLNLLIAMDSVGLLDVVRGPGFPDGFGFHWIPGTHQTLSRPLEEEFKKRTRIHPMLTLIRDPYSYQPATVNHAG